MRRGRRKKPGHFSHVPEVPRVWDPETEISDAIDARQKLQAAMAEHRRHCEAEEIYYTRTLCHELSRSTVVDLQVVLQRNAALKTAEAVGIQRTEALESLQEKIARRIDQLKIDARETVIPVLTKRIEELERSDRPRGGLVEQQLKELKAEVSKLSKSGPKKTGK